MCVSVWVTPATLLTPPGMTSASCSCVRTRTIATRSNSPVTEYTSLTSGIWTSSAAISGIRFTSAFTRTIAVTTGRLLRKSVQPLAVAYPRTIDAPWVPGGQGQRPSAGDFRQRADARLGQPPDQAVQDGSGGPGIGQRAMAWRRRRPEVT